MIKNKLFILSILFFFRTSVIISQEKNVLDKNVYTPAWAHCKISILKRTNDTIFALVDPGCGSFIKVDSTINGFWHVYSNKDSSTLVYRVMISSNKKNGIEYRYDSVLNSKSECNYIDGLKSGFYFQYLYADNTKSRFYPQNPYGYERYYLAFFCNYNMGKKVGQGCFYHPNGALKRIEFYNSKGEVYKKENIK